MAIKAFGGNECYDISIVEIADKKTSKVGELRVRPAAILWKPKSAGKYKKVTIEKFAEWIIEHGKDADR